MARTERLISIISTGKEIADLVKAVGDIELYQKIVDFQGQVVELSGQKLELERENQDLREQLRKRETMVFKKPLYLVEGDDQPFCPVCWEKDGKQIHLDGPSYNYNYQYRCNVRNQGQVENSGSGWQQR